VRIVGYRQSANKGAIPMNTKSQYLMDETEAAKRLAVSVRTVQAWRL
jgi:hypothetical protein